MGQAFPTRPLCDLNEVSAALAVIVSPNGKHPVNAEMNIVSRRHGFPYLPLRAVPELLAQTCGASETPLNPRWEGLFRFARVTERPKKKAGKAGLRW
jgi:hypothetical protein